VQQHQLADRAARCQSCNGGGGLVIRQIPSATHDSPLQEPRPARCLLQREVIVAFDRKEIQSAERIDELIAEHTAKGEGISLDDMIAIQSDQQSAQVRTVLPFFVSLDGGDERQQQAIDLLRAWDGVSTMESAAPAIYTAWRVELERGLIEDDLSGDLYDELATRSHPVFLQRILSDEALGDIWCDNVRTAPRESCADTALAALDRALDTLSERLGSRMDRWAWGDVHQTQYPHRPFSEVNLLRRFFHRSIPNGGDTYTVNVAPVRLTDLYNQYHVPGYRHIIDLQNLNGSFFMITTGQSGNPLSPHYDDFIERHRNVEYLPMTFGRDNVQGDVLTLEPAGE